MRHHTRILLTTLVLIVFKLLSPTTGYSGIQAQAEPYPVTTIPINARNFGMELAPDNHTVAIYENGVLYEGLPEPERLPIRLIDLETGEQTGALTGQSDYTVDVAFSPDSSTLVSYHLNGDVMLWNLATGEAQRTFLLYNLGGGLIQFLPDGKHVMVSGGGFMRIFMMLDTTTGYITRMLSTPYPSRQYYMDTYSQMPGTLELSFNTLDLAPDGEQFLTSNPNGAVLLWDIASNNRFFLQASNLEKPGYFSVSHVEFSPDGSLIAFNDYDKETISVLERDTQKEVVVLPARTLAFTFAPDQQAVAWTDQETSEVKLTMLNDPEHPVTLASFDPEAKTLRNYTALAFTEDGSRLVFGGLGTSDEANALYVIDLK